MIKMLVDKIHKINFTNIIVSLLFKLNEITGVEYLSEHGKVHGKIYEISLKQRSLIYCDLNTTSSPLDKFCFMPLPFMA